VAIPSLSVDSYEHLLQLRGCQMRWYCMRHRRADALHRIVDHTLNLSSPIILFPFAVLNPILLQGLLYNLAIFELDLLLGQVKLIQWP
jgi:hypothetical protein